MSLDPESVNKYRLARSAVQLEDFSVSELVALAEVPEGTAAHFLGELNKRHLLKSVELPSVGKGRPRKSYQLTEEGRKHLVSYMRQVRLRAEVDSVPFPNVEPAEESSPSHYTVLALGPLFKGVESGSKYFIWGAVPGLSMNDVAIVPRANRVTVKATKPTLGLPAWIAKEVSIPDASFSEDVLLPDNFTHPVLLRHTIRNGILSFELGHAAQNSIGKTFAPKFAMKKATRKA